MMIIVQSRYSVTCGYVTTFRATLPILLTNSVPPFEIRLETKYKYDIHCIIDGESRQ